jgi:hypothetical protein
VILFNEKKVFFFKYHKIIKIINTKPQMIDFFCGAHPQPRQAGCFKNATQIPKAFFQKKKNRQKERSGTSRELYKNVF